MRDNGNLDNNTDNANLVLSLVAGSIPNDNKINVLVSQHSKIYNSFSPQQVLN